jgi:hypothetical protein
MQGTPLLANLGHYLFLSSYQQYAGTQVIVPLIITGEGRNVMYFG